MSKFGVYVIVFLTDDTEIIANNKKPIFYCETENNFRDCYTSDRYRAKLFNEKQAKECQLANTYPEKKRANLSQPFKASGPDEYVMFVEIDDTFFKKGPLTIPVPKGYEYDLSD